MKYLTEFQTGLLSRLIDKYESSGFSKGTRTKGSVNVKSDDPVFSKYWSRDSYKYRDDIEADVNELCDGGLISRKVSYNGEILSVSLVLSNVDESFSLLGRVSNASFEADCLKMTEKLSSDCSTPVARRYLEAMEQRLKSHKGYKKWFASGDDINQTVRMVSAIENHGGEEMMRNFSKHHFSNSKIFEKNLPLILSVFNEFGDEPFSDAQQLLNKYGIVRNPGFIQFAGNMVFSVNGQETDLLKYGNVFSLAESTLEQLSIKSVAAGTILTVENLTTFNSIISEIRPETLVIYLGGFASKAQVGFLKKVSCVASGCRWFHFSDIDVGGFRILLDLRNRTAIDFKPFMMNVEMLETYSEECEPLTENDVRELSVMRGSDNYAEVHEIIDYMLSHNIKLEQESIDVSLFHPLLSLPGFFQKNANNI